MNGPEFVRSMEDFKRETGDIQTTIRAALIAVLGELPAIATLAYTGDVADGDLKSFVRRTEELFGTGAPIILTQIVSWATGISGPRNGQDQSGRIP